jgi:NADH-quinone oxidoreductase subunit J
MFSFSFLALFFAICVITSKNPVYSVLSLVMAFCSAAGLLILLNLDFMAMIFLVVYVGAIAVLFLFVVMMINIKAEEITESVPRYLPIYLPVGSLLAAAFLFDILMIVGPSEHPWVNSSQKIVLQNKFLANDLVEWSSMAHQMTNIEAIGQLLYVHFCSHFLLASIILLVAMIGAIVLTLHQDKDGAAKKQEIYVQNLRSTVIT